MHLRVATIASLAALAAAHSAGAQGALPTVAVRGVAYDSLRGVPLRDALIAVAGSEARTTTDELGRFTIEAIVPGVHTFSAQHAMIDSIGLSGIAARMTVTDGLTPVRLAIPSFATLWRTACGATPLPRLGGFVYGTVRDAIGLEPVANATVDLTWIDVAASKDAGISQRRWRGQAHTDATGSYTICGIPTADGLRMQALSDSGASGIINVFPSALRVQRRDLVLGPVTDSDLTRRATITGRVTDERGAAFPDARAFVDEYGEVRSDSGGTVVMRNVPAGTRQVEVLAIGRMPITVTLDLAAGDTGVFIAALRKVTALDVVRVTGTRRQRRLMEDFESRRHSGFGFVLDSTELAQRGRLSSAFESFPSLQVLSRGGQFTLTLPGTRGSRCTPVLFIDGRPSDYDYLNMLRIDELAAVEVYPRRMSAPMQFATRAECGSVVVWTKWAFG